MQKILLKQFTRAKVVVSKSKQLFMKFIPLFTLLFLVTYASFGQHDHTMHETEPHNGQKNQSDSIENRIQSDSLQPRNAPLDSSMHEGHSGMGMDSTMKMYNSFSRNLPMSRTGSGTSWHPDNSPMFMNMYHRKQWNIMVHYGLFLDYTNQNIPRKSGQRGDAMFIVPNWYMAMLNRPVGKRGLFMVRGMFSLDPVFMGGFGYPLLFQTGETWRGEPLVDRQHPHELVSELAIGYSYALHKNLDVFSYLGIPGEPSIGPPAFMHRPSATNIPSSPLGHHWQDATHIIFGVATLGLRYKNIKLEGSSFTGSEPDENRFDFDRPRFNSYSFRLSVNPTKSLALQSSYGYLVSPELHAPGVDVERYSASILHGIILNKNNRISSAFVWGMNKELEDHPLLSNSFLIESNLLTNRYSFFTRIEWVEKSFHELNLEVPNKESLNLINSYALGLSRFIYKGKNIWIDLGIIGTFYLFEDDLIPYYGKRPYSADVFLRLVPAIMRM